MTKQKGFTLIELLIVVAIIGLLATLAIVSLTSAQQRARDTKRVADIKSIQVALELYWNENAAYPALTGASTWAELSTALDDFMSAAPVDPDSADGAVYTYLTATNLYFVGATLENTDHASLDQDIDGTVGGVGFASVTSADNPDATDATFDCADPAYCLKGDATN